MYYLLAFICGVICGAIGAVIYYRRNTAIIEAALSDAVKARKKAEEAFDGIKKKVGG